MRNQINLFLLQIHTFWYYKMQLFNLPVNNNGFMHILLLFFF